MSHCSHEACASRQVKRGESFKGTRRDRPSTAPSVQGGFEVEPCSVQGIDASQYWRQGSRVEDLCVAPQTECAAKSSLTNLFNFEPCTALNSLDCPFSRHLGTDEQFI